MLNDLHNEDAALILTVKVHRLAQQLKSDVAFLGEWLEMPHGGDFFLKGLEAEPWEPHCEGDLWCSLNARNSRIYSPST
jgi:hypothetical protein